MFYKQYLLSLLSTHKQRREGERRGVVMRRRGFLWERELKRGEDWGVRKWGIWRGQWCSREPSLDRGQHLEPLAAGSEPAGRLTNDICQVNSVGTACAETRGREARQLVFLGHRLQLHSLFSFHKPPSVLHSVWEEEVSEQSKEWGENICIHKLVTRSWKSRRERLKRRIFHIWTRQKVTWQMRPTCIFIISACQHLWMCGNFCGLCWLTSTTHKCQDPHNPPEKSSNFSSFFDLIIFFNKRL